VAKNPLNRHERVYSEALTASSLPSERKMAVHVGALGLPIAELFPMADKAAGYILRSRMPGPEGTLASPQISGQVEGRSTLSSDRRSSF
jgi:hypothetical protein